MSVQQIGNAIRFYARFKDGGAGAAGLTVTCTVIKGDGTLLVDAAAATEVNATYFPGLYAYTLASGSVDAGTEYLAWFHTDDTADNADVEAAWLVGPTWVERIDAAVGDAATAAEVATALTTYDAVTRTEATSDKAEVLAALAALNDLDATEAQAAVAAALAAFGAATEANVDADSASILAAIAALNNLSSAGAQAAAAAALLAYGGAGGVLLTEAGGTGDHLTGITVETEVDEAAIAAAVIAGLGGATIVVQSPVRSNGDISIKAGNDYPAGKIVWNVTGASDMTGATVTFYRGDFSAPVTVSNQGEATQTFTLPLTRAVTAALATGPMAFDVNALLADDTLETVIEGRAFVKPSAIVA